MTTDAKEPVDPDADAWLDGLAGRTGLGRSHAEGMALRKALDMEQPRTVNMQDWKDLEARVARASLSGGDVEAQPFSRPEAANRPWWRSWQGFAAMLLLGSVVLALLPVPDETPVLRDSGSAQAIWLVQDPRQSADRLAGELRQIGATVKVLDGEAEVTLIIQASGAAQATVNARLQVLDTALDAQGRLVLKVQAR